MLRVTHSRNSKLNESKRLRLNSCEREIAGYIRLVIIRGYPQESGIFYITGNISEGRKHVDCTNEMLVTLSTSYEKALETIPI